METLTEGIESVRNQAYGNSAELVKSYGDRAETMQSLQSWAKEDMRVVRELVNDVMFIEAIQRHHPQLSHEDVEIAYRRGANAAIADAYMDQKQSHGFGRSAAVPEIARPVVESAIPTPTLEVEPAPKGYLEREMAIKPLGIDRLRSGDELTTESEVRWAVRGADQVTTPWRESREFEAGVNPLGLERRPHLDELVVASQVRNAVESGTSVRDVTETAERTLGDGKWDKSYLESVREQQRAMREPSSAVDAAIAGNREELWARVATTVIGNQESNNKGVGMADQTTNREYRPAAEMNGKELVLETRQIHEQFQALSEQYTTAAPAQREMIQAEMKPLVARETELRQVASGRLSPEISQDRVPEQAISYTR
jgi:hypothetical protein